MDRAVGRISNLCKFQLIIQRMRDGTRLKKQSKGEIRVYNIFSMAKQKKMIMVVLALAVSIMNVSGIAAAQGTSTSKVVANSTISTYGEEVTFTATVLDPVIGGTTPSGTVTFKDGNQDLMTAPLSAAEPIVKSVDKSARPPEGSAAFCYTGPDAGNRAACPIIQWGEYTYWAYSYWDNRDALNIVAYDSSGNIVRQWEKAGARYLWRITMDAEARTFTFWGQDNETGGTVTVGWGDLLSASASASFKTSDLAIGSHAITAVFSGDGNHAASESVLPHTVHPTYTVTYNGNGSTGGDVPTNSSSYNGNKVMVEGNNGNLEKTGYAFAGWNTQADGQGTYYAAGAEGTISSDVMLYAKWNKNLSVGTGTKSDPYQIATVEELDTVRNYLNSGLYFKLMADMDLSSYGQGWLPIGDSSKAFQGNMDGNGHKITGLTINRPNDRFVGLFGNVGYYASVANMQLENVNVTGKQEVGGLIGYSEGKISNSYATGNVTGNGTDVGGLVGVNGREISNSYAAGSVTGNGTDVGGLVGANGGEISNSYATGSVTGNGSEVGGLIGLNAGWISNSYATGSVTGSETDVGGLIGMNYGWIGNSYATGSVTGNGSEVGGLIGKNDDYGEINNSFYDKDATGQSDTDKGDGKTTEQMKLQSTYTDSSWDFASIWGISSSRNNGYPYLLAIQKFVTYDGNGNTGGSAPTDSRSYSQGVTVNVNSDTVTLVKTHYTFAGWNTQADGDGTNYAAGDTFSMGPSDVTLYAKWTLNPTYTVTYNGNGSTGGSVPTDRGAYEQGDTATVYGNNEMLVKTGYTFAGWNTAADGSGTSYAEGASFPIGAENVTLYAKWLSTNALLSGLSADKGTLRFSPTQTNYALVVDNSVSSLNLLLSKGDPAQSLTVTGATYSSVTDNVYSYNASGLAVGPNLIQITVTAEDGANTAYVITVTREYPMGVPVPLDPSVRMLAYPGGLAIRLPDGLAIPEAATLTVQDSNAAPSGEVKLARAGQVIDFRFEGMTVDRPVEITLGYDENSDPSKLAIYYYNLSTGKWEYHPSQVTDHGIKTTVSHFSTYGVLADTTPPDQARVASGAKTTNSITLHLSAYDDSGVAKYLIFRDGTLVAETTESEYVDTGLSASRTYAYTVKAVDMLGNISNASDSITVTTNDGGGGSSYTPTPPPSDAKVTSKDGNLTLPAGKAGEVSLGDEIKIFIPANATGKVLKLTIDKVSDIQKLITNKDVLLSPVFEVLKNFGENFDKPVTLSFKFDPTSLKSNEKPVVFYYDEAKKEWVKVGGTVSGNNITVDVDHFTKYAVLAVADTTPSATDGSTATKASFSDIAAHWAEASIKQAVNLGIVSGYPDGTFKPDRTVTREQFAVMLMNALKPQGDGEALTFTDKAKISPWAQKSVAQAVYAGVITGYKDSSFRPNAEITRAEMAAMIAKALGQTDLAAAASGFADDKDIPEWAKGAVAAMKKLGIVDGKGANQFAPGGKTTRAEAVTVLLKMQAQKSE